MISNFTEINKICEKIKRIEIKRTISFYLPVTGKALVGHTVVFRFASELPNLC